MPNMSQSIDINSYKPYEYERTKPYIGAPTTWDLVDGKTKHWFGASFSHSYENKALNYHGLILTNLENMHFSSNFRWLILFWMVYF